METRFKLILDFVGIILSLVGLALLVADEKYVVSSLIFILFIGLVFHVIRLARSKPYKVKSVKFEYEICDKDASLTKVLKTTVLFPKEKNITKYDDIGITSDGTVTLISTNHGSPRMYKKGGSISVTTTFSTPLEVGKEYTHELSYQGKNCFPAQNENIVCPIIRKMNEAQISIKFHEEKRPSNFRAIHLFRGKTTEVTSSTVKINNLDYDFVFRNPPRGSIFELKWEW